MSTLRNRHSQKTKCSRELIVISDTEEDDVEDEEGENGDEIEYADSAEKKDAAASNVITKQAVVMLTPLNQKSFTSNQSIKSPSLVHSTPLPLVIPDTQPEGNKSVRMNELSSFFTHQSPLNRLKATDSRRSSLDLFKKATRNCSINQQQQQLKIRIAEVKSCSNENERFEFKSSTTVQITTTTTTTTKTERTSTGGNSSVKFDLLKSLVQANNSKQRLSLGAPPPPPPVMNSDDNVSSKKRKSSNSGHVDILKKLLLEKKSDSIHSHV